MDQGRIMKELLEKNFLGVPGPALRALEARPLWSIFQPEP
jgi:hypothetical protein